MPSSKGLKSKGLERRLSDPDTPSPTGHGSQRAEKVEASDRTTAGPDLQPASDPSPTLSREFLTRSQRDGRKDSRSDATPNQSRGKNQGSASQSSPSSSSDGGVLLNIDYDSKDSASHGRGSKERASNRRTSNDQASNGRASNDQTSNGPASNDGASNDRAPTGRTSNDQASTDQASSDRQMNPVSSRGFNVSTSMVEPSQGQNQPLRPDLSQNMSTNQAPRLSYNMRPQSVLSNQTAQSPLTGQYQSFIIDMEQKLTQIPNMPQVALDQLKNDLQKLFLEVNETNRRLRQSLETVKGDREKIRGQLYEALKQLDSVIQDRARISTERDTLQLKVSELGLRSKEVSRNLGDSERQLMKDNEELLERVRIQDEQLKGKRALWMEANPNSASRRRAMSTIQDPIQDPFSSPFQPHNFGAGGGNMSGYNSPNILTPFTGTSPYPGQDRKSQSQNASPQTWGSYAPPLLMRFPTAPSGQSGSPSMRGPLDTFASPNPSHRKGSRRRRHNQVHSPMMANEASHSASRSAHRSFEPPASLRRYSTDPSASMAMVPFVHDEDRYLEFKDGISNIYQLVQNWATAYACLPEPAKEQAIAASNKPLWDYMMNCTYPGHRQEAHDHVVTLLEDKTTRYLLLMRMAVTYCIQDIMSVDAFRLFSQPVSEAIEDAKIRLQERGLANDARQVLIDRQVEAVQSMLASPAFSVFRRDQLNLHTRRLRDMLGPLLNSGCPRQQAGQELGVVAVTAWDLAVKMHTSHLTFQVYFPETTAKFSSSTMVATNSQADPLKLQIQQARLKLVVTPVITMRDDRGTTIKVKNLHVATVMLLE